MCIQVDTSVYVVGVNRGVYRCSVCVSLRGCCAMTRRPWRKWICPSVGEPRSYVGELCGCTVGGLVR